MRRHRDRKVSYNAISILFKSRLCKPGVPRK